MIFVKIVVLVSKAQMSYVPLYGHIMEQTTFVSLQFLENRFCGNSRFMLKTIKTVHV